MNRIFLIALTALVPMLAADQNATQSRPANVVTHLVRLQHADPRSVRNLLTGTGAQVSWDDALHVLVISGTPSDVASLEQTAKQLDAESVHASNSNVDVTVDVVGAAEDSKDTSTLPQALESTVSQLKTLFPYASYQLLETAFARAHVGPYTSLQGSLHPFAHGDIASDAHPAYSLNFTVSGLTGSGADAVIRLSNFSFQARIPYTIKVATNQTQRDTITANIQTSFDVASGKKVVIGKAGAGGSNAIFLVVEAKVAD